MGIQIKLFVASKTPSSFVLNDPYFSIGSATYCDLNVTQPDVPEIACLLEYNSGHNEIRVQTQHSDLVFLGDKKLRPSEKILWNANQELHIGSNCKLVLDPGVSEGSVISKAITKMITPQAAPTEKNAAEVKQRSSSRESTSSHKASRPKQTAKEETVIQKTEVTPKTAQKTQLFQAVVIGFCLIGCLAMMMIDTSSNGKKADVISIGDLTMEIKKTLDSRSLRENEKKSVENIQRQITSAYSERRGSANAKNIYISIKHDLNDPSFSSPQLEDLREKTLNYVNAQLTSK